MSANYRQSNFSTCDLWEVLTYGSIVADDEEHSLVVTVNGAYFNMFEYIGSGEYVCHDCMYADFGLDESASHGLYNRDETTQHLTIVERAEAWIKRWVKAQYDEEDDDEDIKEIVKEFSA